MIASTAFLPSQNMEIGDLGAFSTRFLIWSSDLPRRASWSFWNLRFARLCWGVCAWFGKGGLARLEVDTLELH